MASSPMRRLVSIGHRPHAIDTKRYGQPRVALYYANRSRFVSPGLYLWVGRHVRVLPLPKRKVEATDG